MSHARDPQGTVVPFASIDVGPAGAGQSMERIPMEPRLLATKLFVPVTRAARVHRPRLLEQLERGLTSPLTLLSAAAGSGKTTLVASWLRHHKLNAAWLSLDEADNDVRRFLRYLVAAVQRAYPELGTRTQATMQASDPLEPLDVATELVNEMAAWDGEAVIVLDDYHVVDAPDVGETVAFLVEAAPPNAHLVITSRVDPALPLPRLRARGLLVEVRAPELRFTHEETSEFFREVMRLDLDATQVAKLESRTEGWAVGLQMAALSLRGRSDADSFIDGFAGSHRYVLDYLMDEVLRGLSEDDRRFLMQTSILRELTGPLVDAVTDDDQGSRRLAEFERNNLFVVPLDGDRTAYRYHHLFGTLLHHELEAEVAPAEREMLHRRASRALETAGKTDEAVHHALQASDFDTVERLLVPLVMGSTIRWDVGSIPRLIERIPPQQRWERPRLATLSAWLSYNMGLCEQAQAALAQVRANLGAGIESTVQQELRLLEGMIEVDVGRWERAQQLRDANADWSPTGRPYLEAFRRQHHACLAMLRDDFVEARAELDALLEIVPRTGDVFARLWASWQQAHVDLLLGRLETSRRHHEELLCQATREYQDRPPRSTSVGYATALYVHILLHRIDRAGEILETLLSLQQHVERDAYFDSFLLVPRAWLEVVQGKGAAFEDTLDAAVRSLDAKEQDAIVPRVEATRVRLAMHDRSSVDGTGYAQRWLDTPGIRDQTHDVFRSSPPPGTQVDMPRFVLARALAELGELDEALTLATQLADRAAAARRVTCELEARLLRASIHHRLDRPHNAEQDWTRAVELAASDAIVGPFVEFESSALAPALRLAQAGGHHALVTGLQRVRPVEKSPAAPAVAPPRLRIEPESKPADPREPLSNRELEVLSLVAQGMSNAEASKKLFVAPSTVKKHLEHVYGKLGVNRRTHAVARARALGLLAI